MRLTRVHVALPLAEHAEYRLTGATAHYLTRVLRVHDGSPLLVFNGKGGQFQAQVQAVRKGEVKIRTGRYEAVERESPVAIVLGHSLCRAERSDYVVQKATELGVSRIDPLLTERTMVRLEAQRALRRVTHWQAIAVHACEQCGRNHVPEISPVRSLGDWLAGQWATAVRLVLDKRACGCLQAMPEATGQVVVLIGPEGGFTAAELRLAETAGFNAFQLGPRTMRSDTATVAALVALQLRFGDLS